MRAFLAVTPDPETCRNIDAWRNRCWPVISRAVPAQNFHITLAYLGDVSAKQLATLDKLANDWTFTPFELTLNDVGYWPDARCLWLAPPSDNSTNTRTSEQNPGKQLLQLASSCSTAANRMGVRVRKKTYSPHLTLARGVDTPPAQALTQPDFTLEVVSVELYQSIRESSGARYIEQRSWPLHQL